MVKITSGFLNKAMRKLYYVRSHWLAFQDFADVQRFRAGCLCDFFNSAALLAKQDRHPNMSKKFSRIHSITFSLYPTSKALRPLTKSRLQIRTEANQRATQWQALIGTNGIDARAVLAGYLGVSRAGLTQVFNRLMNQSSE